MYPNGLEPQPTRKLTRVLEPGEAPFIERSEPGEAAPACRPDVRSRRCTTGRPRSHGACVARR
jgi:hypothetical protein